MENTVKDQVQVAPDIVMLNKYLNRVQQVAVSAMAPIYTTAEGRRTLSAFHIQLEGPPRHMSYLHRLLDQAKLKIS